MSSLQPFMNSSNFSYEICLIPNIPETVQYLILDITNFVINPLDTLLAVSSFIVNSLMMTAIARTKALQIPPQLLLCSLAATDFLWGLVSIVKHIVVITKLAGDTGKMCVKANNEIISQTALCFASSMGNLAIISRDRYLAIDRPLWYHDNVKRSHALKKAMAIWLISILITVMIYVGNDASPSTTGPFIFIARTISTIFYVICLVTMATSYTGIYLAIKRHKLNRQQRGGANLRSVLEREKKVATTVAWILLVLVFTFLPALVTPWILSITGFPMDRIGSVAPLFSVLVSLNGLLNPLFSFGRNREMQKALRKLVWCHPGNRQIGP